MTWTATILKHNDDGLTMDVEFQRAGYDPITVGMLLPPQGADLQAHVAQYAPVSTWDWVDQMRIERDVPPLGMVVQAPTPAEPVGPAEPAAPTDPAPSEIVFEL